MVALDSDEDEEEALEDDDTIEGDEDLDEIDYSAEQAKQIQAE